MEELVEELFTVWSPVLSAGVLNKSNSAEAMVPDDLLMNSNAPTSCSAQSQARLEVIFWNPPNLSGGEMIPPDIVTESFLEVLLKYKCFTSYSQV